MSLDLFGDPMLRDKKLEKGKSGKPNGYAGVPGRGPSGESCKTCQFACRINYHDKTYYKCEKNRPWTHGLGSDIRLKSPACELWQKEEANQ